MAKIKPKLSTKSKLMDYIFNNPKRRIWMRFKESEQIIKDERKKNRNKIEQSIEERTLLSASK